MQNPDKSTARIDRGADSMGHEGHVPPPHFYKWLSTGTPSVGEQQTRNWPNCTDHHESAHQND